MTPKQPMTTYNTTYTINHDVGDDDECTFTVCSSCAYTLMIDFQLFSQRHTNYEFDETCHQCNRPLPAS